MAQQCIAFGVWLERKCCAQCLDARAPFCVRVCACACVPARTKTSAVVRKRARKSESKRVKVAACTWHESSLVHALAS
eukprot:5034310-Pleurochrysis_carterae.AAC.1